MRHYLLYVTIAVALMGCKMTPSVPASAQDTAAGNQPARSEWFMDLGLGMFVHWSMDSQLGMVISHSMVGASDDYLDRYINDLPQTFNPDKFDPEEWARLAKTAGMKYVVFTTKHHNGFCMYDTKTTGFNIMNTPYGRDITRQVARAFRKYDIPVGFYFSPDDFWILHGQDRDISRRRPEANPKNNPELMNHNQNQVRELLTRYGPIHMFFIDGEETGLKDLIWRLQPEILITRGEMETPEQEMPDEPMPGPWEACFTLGTQWQFKPTNEDYKSGTTLIEMLIETRAKGGNLLLNVGPQPDGVIPFEQERRMRELGLWLFINGEAIYNIRPWHVIREGDIWFTRAKEAGTVYAILTRNPDWQHGQRKEFLLKSVKATEDTKIDVLGQTGRVVEYKPEIDAQTKWHQDEQGLHISVVRAQRIYNDKQWPNPIVIKITQAEPVERPSRNAEQM